MATLKDLRNVRIEKLNKLRAKNIDPYPAKSYRNTLTGDIANKFEEFEGTVVVVAGMVSSVREHGKLSFFDLKDASGVVQLYIKGENLTGANYKNSELNFGDLELLDVGDYVEAEGEVTKTNAGEVSVEVKKLRILSKSLRPLPNSRDGFKDKETRMRRRYLDTKINKDVYERYKRRAKFWEAHRKFFNDRGFLEINIPVLEMVPGGADATPFVTHMDAIDQDFYLRISQELYLKRLIGGGYEKVFEVGPRFRNEGLSDEHLPEHMAMEFYWAYADWKDGMKIVEDLFAFIIDEVYGGKKKFTIRGFEVDFSKGWEVIDFAEMMEKKYKIDVHDIGLNEVRKICDDHGIKEKYVPNVNRGIDALWKLVRKEIAGPAFLANHPKFLSPLSKSKYDEPHITERFQPIIAGSELGNGWSEINDPIDQLERFREQQAMRDAGDEEAQWLDIDYVEMLEYGMPPTFGYGHSERIFWFLEDVSAREGVPFPQLKYVLDESTKKIYGLGDADNGEVDHESDEIDNKNLSGLPTAEEALKLLDEHVKEDYQKLHVKMVSEVLKAYADELDEDKDLWRVTGLLHDLDYCEFPDEHPKKELEWFEEWGYPEQLIHAVAAHVHGRTGVKPKTKLAYALIATDELAGFLYAYSLMRPDGFEGMKASSAKKKFKDKAFAKKVDREEINYGMELFGVDFGDHVDFMIKVYGDMEELENA